MKVIIPDNVPIEDHTCDGDEWTFCCFYITDWHVRSMSFYSLTDEAMMLRIDDRGSGFIDIMRSEIE